MPNVVQRDKHTARLRRGRRIWDLGARPDNWAERKEESLLRPSSSTT